MNKSLENIVEYYTDMFHLDKHTDPPANVITQLNELDRVERGALKSRLFNEAKRLGVGGDGIRAIRWLESTFDQIEKYSFRLHDVVFSPGQDIPENIAFYLSQAKKSIDLCVFTISDEKLCACLKLLHKKGIKIRLLTDNNKMRDSGSQVKELARSGIEVKTDNSRYHMHNKFGIIDGRIAFTGSYNWTYTAQAYNQENLVITTNFTIVHKFITEFETLWEQMFWLRVKQTKDGMLRAKVKVEDKYEELTFANLRNQSQQSKEYDEDEDEPSGPHRQPEASNAQNSHRKKIKERRNVEAKNGEWRPNNKRERSEGHNHGKRRH